MRHLSVHPSAFLLQIVENQEGLSFEVHFRLVTIHPWVDGNGRMSRLVMNMIQRQLGLVPSIVRKEDKGEYIQSLIDSRSNENSRIAQDTMLSQHIENLRRRIIEYHDDTVNDTVNSTFEIVGDTISSPSGGLSGLSPVLGRIYDEIKGNPEITHKHLAELLHISESTSKRATRELKRLGYIKREGSDKSGRWSILK